MRSSRLLRYQRNNWRNVLLDVSRLHPLSKAVFPQELGGSLCWRFTFVRGGGLPQSFLVCRRHGIVRCTNFINALGGRCVVLLGEVSLQKFLGQSVASAALRHQVQRDLLEAAMTPAICCFLLAASPKVTFDVELLPFELL